MLQYVIVGFVFGSIYALMASGLVITFVSAGILNFSFGALAYFVARFYYWLHVQNSWGIWSSAALSLLVVAPLLGLVLYVLIFRYLRLSSQLLKVVVTIGLAVTVLPISNVLFGNVNIIHAPGLAAEP